MDGQISWDLLLYATLNHLRPANEHSSYPRMFTRILPTVKSLTGNVQSKQQKVLTFLEKYQEKDEWGGDLSTVLGIWSFFFDSDLSFSSYPTKPTFRFLCFSSKLGYICSNHYHFVQEREANLSVCLGGAFVPGKHCFFRDFLCCFGLNSVGFGSFPQKLGNEWLGGEIRLVTASGFS